MTPEELAELKRTNDLKGREVSALESIAAAAPSQNVIQTISRWYEDARTRSTRVNY